MILAMRHRFDRIDARPPLRARGWLWPSRVSPAGATARRRRWGAGLLCAILLLAGCGPEPVHTSPRSDIRLPRVTLSALPGNPAASTDEWLGRPLLINVWATWCRPCREEMPSLEQLSRRLAGHGVRVIGVTLDADLNLAMEFVRRNGLTFPNYADGMSRPLRHSLRIDALPETLLVAADGSITARVLGARDWGSAETDRLLERSLGLHLAGPPEGAFR